MGCGPQPDQGKNPSIAGMEIALRGFRKWRGSVNVPTLDDVVVATLKKRYFDIIVREDYPRTPLITNEADHLEEAINTLKAKAPSAGGPS